MVQLNFIGGGSSAAWLSTAVAGSTCADFNNQHINSLATTQHSQRYMKQHNQPPTLSLFIIDIKSTIIRIALTNNCKPDKI